MIRAFGKNYETVPPTALGGGKALKRESIHHFEKSGGAASFKIISEPWQETIKIRIRPRPAEGGNSESSAPDLPMVP